MVPTCVITFPPDTGVNPAGDAGDTSPQYFGWGDVKGNVPQYYYVLSDIADQYWLPSVRSASSRFHSAIRRHQFASVKQADSRLTRLVPPTLNSRWRHWTLNLYLRPWRSKTTYINARWLLVIVRYTNTLTYLLTYIMPVPKNSHWSQHICSLSNKKLNYRRGTARCVVSFEVLPLLPRNSAETTCATSPEPAVANWPVRQKCAVDSAWRSVR